MAAVAHDIASAERYERAAIAIAPDNVDFQYSLAKILESAGKKAEARQVYQKIVFTSKDSRHLSTVTYQKAALRELARLSMPRKG